MSARTRIALGAIGVSVCAAVAVAVGAGSDDSGDPGDAEVSAVVTTAAPTTGAPSTTLPSTTTTTRGPRGSGVAVTFAFGGDTHFEGELGPQLDADPAGMLAPIAPILRSADIAMVNLESAITERGAAEPKAFTFRAPARGLTAIASAGVDIVSMANNHGIDFGPEGLLDSLAAEQQHGLPIVGIGANAAEAYAPHIIEVNGQRIAILAATQVLDDHLIATWTATDTSPGIASAKEIDRLLAVVREARTTSDTVVVFLHWGTERETCPTDRQRELAWQLADAGADVIVGGHAHRVQGAGRLGGAFVAYGLGNFVWYADPGPSAETGVLLVTVTGREIDAFDWVPARIRTGVPRPLEGDDAVTARTAWDERRGCTGLSA
ncbi:MAG: CapA family protein [Actinomycetota bacterium]